jgi:aryl-alcohol dehydrogenase-like predicted oxidoreductase
MIARYSLQDGYEISRLIKGGWHLAGGHGDIDPRHAIVDMAQFVEAGVTSFDCADIYTGVEELIGQFRRAFPSLAGRLQVHTKFVPDLGMLDHVDAEYVERIVDRSLARLGVEVLDLVQFHWWDFATPGYVEAAQELERLRIKGKIARIGVTNFDTKHLCEIVDAGVPIRAHQMQYSLLDRRPDGRMVDYCVENDIALLCYGTVAGGFLSDRWLGRPAPAGALPNRSLVKYKLIIDEFGSWDDFQQLLSVLRTIADEHQTDVASIATKAILDLPGVGAAIVGATSTRHLGSHERLDQLQLTAIDSARIYDILKQHPGPQGDVYELERDRNGPHGRIMKYDLND